jgi:hypothetical protein
MRFLMRIFRAGGANRARPGDMDKGAWKAVIEQALGKKLAPPKPKPKSK